MPYHLDYEIEFQRDAREQLFRKRQSPTSSASDGPTSITSRSRSPLDPTTTSRPSSTPIVTRTTSRRTGISTNPTTTNTSRSGISTVPTTATTTTAAVSVATTPTTTTAIVTTTTTTPITTVAPSTTLPTLAPTTQPLSSITAWTRVTSTATDGSVYTVTDFVAGPTGLSSNSSGGFFKNKAAVAATFVIVGIAATAILITGVMTYIRRRRQKQFDKDVMLTAAAAARTSQRKPPADDDYYSDMGPPHEDAPSAGSHGIYQQPPMTQYNNTPAYNGGYKDSRPPAGISNSAPPAHNQPQAGGYDYGNRGYYPDSGYGNQGQQSQGYYSSGYQHQDQYGGAYGQQDQYGGAYKYDNNYAPAQPGASSSQQPQAHHYDDAYGGYETYAPVSAPVGVNRKMSNGKNLDNSRRPGAESVMSGSRYSGEDDDGAAAAAAVNNYYGPGRTGGLRVANE